MLSAQEVRLLAVKCFGGGGSSEESLALVSFQSDESAWSVGTQILSDPESFPEIQAQFFAAITLYTKLGTEWVALGNEEKSALRDLLTKLVSVYHERNTPMVAKRLCLCLSRFGAHSLSLFWGSFIEDVVTLVGNIDTRLMVDTLSNLPEEVDAALMPQSKRDKTVSLMKGQREAVFNIMDQVLSSDDSCPHDSVYHALACIENWARMGPPLHFFYSSPLFEKVFAMVSKEELFEPSIQVLVEAVGRPLETDKAVHQTVSRVLHLVDLYGAAKGKEDMHHVCKGITKLVVALGEENLNLLCRGTEEAQALVAFIMECTRHPDRDVSIYTLSFWHKFQEAMEENPTHMLRFKAHYKSLMDLLLGACAVPEEAAASCSAGDPGILAAAVSLGPQWSSGAPVDLSETLLGWRRYRLEAKEAFKAIHRIALDEYLAHLWSLISSLAGDVGANAVLLESAMFAVESVAFSLTRVVAKTQCRHPNNQHLKAIISTSVSSVTGGTLPPSAFIPLGHAASNLIGAYHKWFALDKTLQADCVAYLREALKLDLSTGIPSSASSSLLKLSKAMGPDMAAYLESLLSLWSETAALHSLHTSDRENVLLSLVSSSAFLDEPSFGRLVVGCVSVLLQQIKKLSAADKSALAAQGNEKLFAQAAVNELDLLALVFRETQTRVFKGEHPLSPVANESWAMLTSLLIVWADTEDIVDAVCVVFEAAFLSLGARMKPANVESTIPMLHECFMATGHAGCLSVVSSIIQAFGMMKELSAQFANVVASMTEGMASERRATDPQVIAAYFDMVNHMVHYFPEEFLRSDVRETAITLALSSLSTSDREAARSVLSFLHRLASPQGTEELQQVVVQLVQGYGQALLLGIVQGMVQTVHRNIVHYQSEVLHTLIHNYHNEIMGQWVFECFASIDSPFLKGEEKAKVAHLVWNTKDKRRFKALMADLSLVLNAEMTSDVLTLYEF